MPGTPPAPEVRPGAGWKLRKDLPAAMGEASSRRDASPDAPESFLSEHGGKLLAAAMALLAGGGFFLSEAGVAAPTAAARVQPAAEAVESASSAAASLHATTPPLEAKQDPALSLFWRIREGRYDSPEDVAAGPFLGDFEHQSKLLDGIDPSALRTLARGSDWAQIEAIYHPPARWDEPEKKPVLLHVYLIKVGSLWKLERIRVHPRRSPWELE